MTSISDTNLYRGFDGIQHDSTVVYLDNYPNFMSAFIIHGMFNMGPTNPNTLIGTWTGYYGEGQFTAHRTF